MSILKNCWSGLCFPKELSMEDREQVEQEAGLLRGVYFIIIHPKIARKIIVFTLKFNFATNFLNKIRISRHLYCNTLPARCGLRKFCAHKT